MELLVVDDEPEILGLCRRGLGDSETTVGIAASSSEAEKLLQSRPFDILLTDILIGPADGIELVRMARRRYPGMDVILMTGFPSMDKVINALKLGAYDFIVKPLDLILLKATIRRCMEQRALRDHLRAASHAAEEIESRARGLASRLSELWKLTNNKDRELEQDACQSLAESLVSNLANLRKTIEAPPIRDK